MPQSNKLSLLNLFPISQGLTTHHLTQTSPYLISRYRRLIIQSLTFILCQMKLKIRLISIIIISASTRKILVSLFIVDTLYMPSSRFHLIHEHRRRQLVKPLSLFYGCLILPFSLLLQNDEKRIVNYWINFLHHVLQILAKIIKAKIFVVITILRINLYPLFFIKSVW